MSSSTLSVYHLNTKNAKSNQRNLTKNITIIKNCVIIPYMKTYHNNLINLFIGILIFALFFGAIAIPNTQAASDLKDKTKSLEKINKEKKQVKKVIDLNKKTVKVLEIQKIRINSEIGKLSSTINKTRTELQTIQSDIKRINTGIAEQEKLIQRQQKTLAQLVRARYKAHAGAGTNTSTNSLSQLLFVHTAQARTSDYLSQTSAQITQTLEKLNKLRQKMGKDHKKLSEKKEKLSEEKEKLDQREQYLESSKNYKTFLANKAKVKIAQNKKKLSKLEEQEIEIRREIENIELGKLDNINYANLPSRSKADLRMPVDAVRLTQGYGKTSFSYVYRSGRHNAWDLALKNGKSAIRAAGDGKVIATGNMGRYGYGRWAAVNHGNGLVTFYAHMRSVKVRSGSKIKKGDKIGIMGSTGFSTGTHLHFTIYAANTFSIVNSSKVKGLKIPTGASVNPGRYLSL